MKTTITIISLSAILASLTLSAQQTARPAGSGLAERFKQLDRNGDGKLTAAELPRPEIFQRLDRNSDGVIERNEIPAVANRQERPNRPRSAGTGDLEMPEEPAHTRDLDLRYDEIDGIDPNLLSLDLYVPKRGGEKRPVMIMIHGGGWRKGDKASPAIVGAKMRHFVGEGYIYASINYQLSPQTPAPDGLKYPVHAQDCAKAIAWIHDHIAEYGGDPDQLHLMGHSAGGHLAAILGTNEHFLEAEGKNLSILKTNVLLDPAAIDIPGYLKSVGGQGMTALYALAFGEDETNRRDASPQDHVAADKDIPPTLVFYAGERMALNVFGPAFAKSLTEAGSPSRAVDTVTLDHGQINSRIGMINEPMTALITKLHAGDDPSKFPARIGPVISLPESSETSSRNKQSTIHFTRDYFPGTRDSNGEFMGGTETMRIVAHNGKLFAGNGFWTDQPGDDPRPGAQILVKRGPEVPWEVSRNFPSAGRINAMESFIFTTDHTGAALGEPVTLLVADAGLLQARDHGALRCFVHNDATGDWNESEIRPDAPRAFIRAFGFHHDTDTGIDHIFAGTGGGEIYRGVYDPEAPGRIRWSAQPEYANPDFDGGAFKRCQGFCVANGKLYASVAPRLLERKDGPKPAWEEVFRWTPQQRAGAGLRGITAVPALEGDHEVILGSREQEGRILRIDPSNDYEVTDELRSDEFLKEQLGQFRSGKLVAYNRFVPGIHPLTGEPIHWLTVAGFKPGDLNAAWLLIRHADATYEPVRVFDPDLDDPPVLISTRTLEFAPWSDREFYTGGYDGAANNRKNHNTAWIFKATLPARNEKRGRP